MLPIDFLEKNWADKKLHSYLAAPTDDAYEVACKKRGFMPNSEVLEDGTRAHWIGSNKAEKLVLNFHGQSPSDPISRKSYI